MIGTARDTRRFRRGPVLGEFVVDAVAALGRLDPGEPHAGGAYARPVDVALVFGDVYAAHFVIGWAREEIVAGDPARAAAGEQREAEPKK